MSKRLAPSDHRLIPFYLVAVQLRDNRVGFVDGDAVTSRREHATAFRDESRAKALASAWGSRSDVKAAWVLHEPKMAKPRQPQVLAPE